MGYDALFESYRKHISLTTDDEDTIRQLFTPKTLKAKAILLRAGEVCRYEYFVSEGCLRSFSVDANGFEHSLMFSIEYWWAGDLYSFFTKSQPPFL